MLSIKLAGLRQWPIREKSMVFIGQIIQPYYLDCGTLYVLKVYMCARAYGMVPEPHGLTHEGQPRTHIVTF